MPAYSAPIAGTPLQGDDGAAPAGVPVPDLVLALSDEGGRLSAMERKLADYVMANVSAALNASITEVAAGAGVSPPTVTRFCRRVGCASFSDFKVQLAKSAYVGLRYLNPEAITSTAPEVAEDIVTKAQNALFAVHRTLDLPAIEAAARALAGARMIYAFGSGGNSSMIVNELQNRLFRLGCHISASNDHGMNLMLSAAAGPETVVFGSSFTGRNMELVRSLELLRARGITTIALTQGGSPVAEVAEILIPVNLPEGKNIFRASSTRYAFLVVIDIIANLVAYADKPRSTRILRGIKEQLVRQRDGDDRQLLGD